MYVIDQQEHTPSGRFGAAHKLVLEPEDYNPNDVYWVRKAKTAKFTLDDLIGNVNAYIWSEMAWPNDTIEKLSYKEIALAYQAALEQGADALLADLICTCGENKVNACRPCAAQERINARVEEML